MRLLLLLIVFLSYTIQTYSQEYLLKAEISIPEGFFTTDPMGNVLVYHKGDITKFSPLGMELARFSTRDFGDISHVDASNPQKILVVFSDFSKAVILDASLGRNASFDLTFDGIQLVKAICSSRESGYWYFDPAEKRLKKIDDQLNVTIEGTTLRQVTDEPVEPTILYDSGNWLIMNAPDFGFLIFDRFGTYFKTIKPSGSGDFQAINDEILFKENDKMCSVNIKTGVHKHFILPENEAADICRVEGQRIFLLQKNILKIYSF